MPINLTFTPEVAERWVNDAEDQYSENNPAATHERRVFFKDSLANHKHLGISILDNGQNVDLDGTLLVKFIERPNEDMTGYNDLLLKMRDKDQAKFPYGWLAVSLDLDIEVEIHMPPSRFLGVWELATTPLGLLRITINTDYWLLRDNKPTRDDALELTEDRMLAIDSYHVRQILLPTPPEPKKKRGIFG